MQTGRLFELLYLLLERRSMTAAELAKRFEVSQRTIYRDVDLLSGAGIPVYASRGKGGGIRLMEGYVLDRSLLTRTQQDEILFALQSLQATHAIQGGELLAQLRGAFSRPPEDWIEVDFSPWGNIPGEREKFNLLKSAILERRPVAFAYFSGAGGFGERQVEPAKLCYKSGGWYLQGFCRSRQAPRTFKISRMRQLQLLEGSFARREMPPIDLPGTAPEEGILQACLRFAPAAAYRLYDELPACDIHPDPDGSYTVTTWLTEGSGTVDYLLSFGTQLTVLSPGPLRQALCRRAQEIAGIYSEYDKQLSDFG